MEHRALSLWEKRTIKQLVHTSCANFDQEYGCLLMDCPCYMCHKYYTGAFCRYFRKCVLPLNTTLRASLEERNGEIKHCKLCQKSFVPSSKEWYCSEACRKQARQITFREAQRKHRASK